VEREDEASENGRPRCLGTICRSALPASENGSRRDAVSEPVPCQWGTGGTQARRPLACASVLNLSLGHAPYESADTDPLVAAVKRATDAGLIVVVAAGNVGKNPITGVVRDGGITVPGNAPTAITVGSGHVMGRLVEPTTASATTTRAAPPGTSRMQSRT
jgi:subtilisin family serine protease